MSQLPLFDPGKGRGRRNAGIQSVTINGIDWNIAACQKLMEFARIRPEWLLEDFRRWFLVDLDLPPPHHHNAWGAVARWAAVAKLIERTGRMRASADVRSHARAQPLWRITDKGLARNR